MKRKLSIALALTLLITLLAGLSTTTAAAVGSSQTFYIGSAEFGATITFPTFLGMTEVTVSSKYDSSETVKTTYPVVAYPGEGNPWYYINDIKGVLKDADWLSQKGTVADCYGISFQLDYWLNDFFAFGDSGAEMLAEFYTQDQLDVLQKSNPFIGYPGQYGGTGFLMTDKGTAPGTAESGMASDPYIHYFNLDIGSSITTISGEDLGKSVLVIPESTIGNYNITPKTGGAPVYAPLKAVAGKTTSTVLVNGLDTAFDAYNIGGSNYFKLRDIAKVLSGSAKQFEVTWNGDVRAINLLTGQPYTTLGGEMAISTGAAQITATLNTATIYLDNQVIALTAYTINNNNYFKLRDLGRALSFGVDWDSAAQTILIDTSKGYTE